MSLTKRHKMRSDGPLRGCQHPPLSTGNSFIPWLRFAKMMHVFGTPGRIWCAVWARVVGEPHNQACTGIRFLSLETGVKMPSGFFDWAFKLINQTWSFHLGAAKCIQNLPARGRVRRPYGPLPGSTCVLSCFCFQFWFFLSSVIQV